MVWMLSTLKYPNWIWLLALAQKFTLTRDQTGEE
jgi:hypothetical protein